MVSKTEITEKLVERAAFSKTGRFVDNVRLGWNNYNFIFYIGGISAILGGIFGLAGWASAVITVLFFYYTGRLKERIDFGREKRKKEKELEQKAK